jgi:hypothetical protein
VQPLAPQIEVAVAQPNILRIIGLPATGSGSSCAADWTVTARANSSISPVGKLRLTVPAPRALTVPSIVTTDSTRTDSSAGSAGESLSATIWVIRNDRADR